MPLRIPGNSHFKQIFDGFLGDLRRKISPRRKQLHIHSLDGHTIRAIVDNSNIFKDSQGLPHWNPADTKLRSQFPL